METHPALSAAALVSLIIEWLTKALAAFQAGLLAPERQTRPRADKTPEPRAVAKNGWRRWRWPDPFKWLRESPPLPKFGAGPFEDAAPTDDDPAEMPTVPSPIAEPRRVAASPAPIRSCRNGENPAADFSELAPLIEPAPGRTNGAGIFIARRDGFGFLARGRVALGVLRARVRPANALLQRRDKFSNSVFSVAIFHAHFVTI